MLYTYRCGECGAEEDAQRPIAQRDDPLYCYCRDPEDASLGTPMKRVIGNVQILWPRAMRDTDWFGRGMDQSDMKALRAQDEKNYEASWGGNTPSRPKRAHERTRMADLLKQAQGAG
jgi:hypothetical protein